MPGLLFTISFVSGFLNYGVGTMTFTAPGRDTQHIDAPWSFFLLASTLEMTARLYISLITISILPCMMVLCVT